MVDCGEEVDVVVGRVGRVEGLEMLEEGLSGTALLRGVAGTAQLGCVCEGGDGNISKCCNDKCGMKAILTLAVCMHSMAFNSSFISSSFDPSSFSS